MLDHVHSDYDWQDNHVCTKTTEDREGYHSIFVGSNMISDITYNRLYNCVEESVVQNNRKGSYPVKR